MLTGDQSDKITKIKHSLLHLEGSPNEETNKWKSQRVKLIKLIAKLKFAQVNDFEILLDICIFIDSCLPLESDDSDESDTQVPTFEIFEFIDANLSALN